VVCDEPPEQGQSLVQSVEWIGQPKRKHLPEYLRFCHVVNAHLADLWQMSILQLPQTSPTNLEAWEYRPGQAPKRAMTSTSTRRALNAFAIVFNRSGCLFA
jgi:hypothetical protein